MSQYTKKSIKILLVFTPVWQPGLPISALLRSLKKREWNTAHSSRLKFILNRNRSSTACSAPTGSLNSQSGAQIHQISGSGGATDALFHSESEKST